MDVIWNLSGGIRKLNNDIARGVSKWYRDTWWQEANIVATDFFLRSVSNFDQIHMKHFLQP